MVTWLLVYGFLLLLMALKRLLLIFLLGRDLDYQRLEWRIEMVYFCTVLNFEVGWLVYGNVFHYGSQSTWCSAHNPAAHSLWLLMTFILIWGYLLFFFYLVMLVGTVLFMCNLISYRRA